LIPIASNSRGASPPFVYKPLAFSFGAVGFEIDTIGLYQFQNQPKRAVFQVPFQSQGSAGQCLVIETICFDQVFVVDPTESNGKMAVAIWEKHPNCHSHFVNVQFSPTRPSRPPRGAPPSPLVL